MKIAYVSYNQMHSIANGGVGLKIRTAVRNWNEAGHTAHWFLTTSADVSGDEVTAFRFGVGKRGLGREIDRSQQLARMIDAVAEFKPDVIYLRSGIYTYPLHRLFAIAPVVVELNTIDLVEYKMRGAFIYAVHRLTRDLIFKRVSGFVAVSYEIGAQHSNLKYNKPIKVLGNTIDLRQYKPLPAPNNATPRLVYIGVPDNPWHGLDKLFWLAENCPDLEFDLIGSSLENFTGQFIPSNVQLHGFVDRSAYQKILAKADVGIGSLALHRIDIHEGSPLKVREYLAYGLPLFLAYKDTDLIGTEFEFVLQIANTEDNLRSNVAQIRQFAFDMQGKRAERQLIAPLIDTKYKEQQRLDFMKQFVVGM